jgi:hypothetical protein
LRARQPIATARTQVPKGLGCRAVRGQNEAHAHHTSWLDGTRVGVRPYATALPRRSGAPPTESALQPLSANPFTVLPDLRTLSAWARLPLNCGPPRGLRRRRCAAQADEQAGRYRASGQLSRSGQPGSQIDTSHTYTNHLSLFSLPPSRIPAFLSSLYRALFKSSDTSSFAFLFRVQISFLTFILFVFLVSQLFSPLSIGRPQKARIPAVSAW